jgi:Flp pilus assembly protein CpaB
VRRRLSAIIALLGVLLLAGAVGSGLLAPACACAQPVASPGTVDVIIALVDIPVGTVIEPSMVTKQTILASAAAPDAFHDPAQVIGEAAWVFIKAGSQIKVRGL